ncbi:unnamed protein product [Meloidogyne enterolobii]
MFGLSIVNEDSDKIGTVCLSTISLDVSFFFKLISTIVVIFNYYNLTKSS